MRLRQVLAIRAVAFDEVGDSVESQAVDANVEPEAHRVDDRFHDAGIFEIQIGLMTIEAMPVVRLRDRVPCPVRRFRIEKK